MNNVTYLCNVHIGKKEKRVNKITLLDGAMGTMIQAAGLPLGARPELFTMEHEDILASIHQQYMDAGSEIIYANTFGANAHKLKGLGVSVRQVLEKYCDCKICCKKSSEGCP